MAELKQARGMLPAKDFDRAKAWWSETFGLRPVQELGSQGAYYEIGGSWFLVYPSAFAGTNQATAMGLHVDDVAGMVGELRAKGVRFEDYDLPGLKTESGIATLEEAGRTVKVAWFKDSEGNIISLGDV